MAFIDSVKGAISQQPPKLTKPDFYKADSDSKNQLEQLKGILQTVPDNMKSQLDQDIKMLSYGISGEDYVAFELNNSYTPMIVLHDLHIEHDGLSVQIDYLVITKKFVLIVECKNLVGNIEVNSNGDFIRTTEYRGKYKKEGIYSPITQNTRHLDMIKKIKLANKNNMFIKKMFEKIFDNIYKSVVVLANPKTVINMKYAKKEVKDKIIRCDQLNEYIKKLLQESKDDPFTDKDMYERADWFLSMHTPNQVDYTKKYFRDEAIEKFEEIETEQVSSSIEVVELKAITNIEETPLYKDLKQYRYEVSKKEGVKAYCIFNNAQMEALISAKPKSIDEIRAISGFGDLKCQKYGDAIIEILKSYF